MKETLNCINNKTYIYLLALSFVLSKYSFIFFSKQSLSKEEIFAFFNCTLIYLIIRLLKALLTASTPGLKLKEYLEAFGLLFIYILVPILICGILAKLKLDFSIETNIEITKAIISFIVIIASPFLLTDFMIFQENQILDKISENQQIDLEQEEKIRFKFQMYIFGPICLISILIGGLCSFLKSQ